MKFAVIGAGGIGCYYAARLLNAGNDVALIARGKHLQAMQENGLTVKHAELKFKQAVQAFSLDEWFEQTPANQVDVIIVCLKAMQTKVFTEQLSAWFKQNETTNLPLVLSLQNGVENEKYLVDALPKGLVMGGIARRIGSQITEPGVVESIGPAQVILGLWPNHQCLDASLSTKITALAECFNEAHIPTEIAQDINKELWRKLIINNGLNPICALLEMKTGEATPRDDLKPLIKGVMREAVLAAKANDVELTADDLEEMLELISTFDSIKPSMLVDREKARPLEIEEICGVVIRGCEKLGVDAPYNRTISTLLSVLINK
ncbi:MAG: 2-dehydropantoate 2-reductase [Cycloclasticus sp.]